MMKKGLKIRRKGGFKPMSVIMEMTKESILYRIKEKLKTYSKKRLAVFYYNLLKNDLPQLNLSQNITGITKPVPASLNFFSIKRKKKRKMTLAQKKKFLARLNKGRRKAGLKPIRAKR
jgi:hypothetical protein